MNPDEGILCERADKQAGNAVVMNTKPDQIHYQMEREVVRLGLAPGLR